MKITSKENSKIKYINSLKNKKFRDKYSKYILEGIKLVDEHISSEGVSASEFIVYCPEILLNNVGGEKVYSKIKDLDNTLEVDESVFKYLTDTETPQGILIVLDKKQPKITDLVNNIKNNEKIIVLDMVSDSGNIGTIIRTAVSFNVQNIICIKGSADVYSSKVVRSAMGALQKVNIFYLDYNEIELLKTNLKNNGYKLIVTDLKAEKYTHEYTMSDKLVFILGNEANGVSDKMKALSDDSIKIPMEATQESLNVGIAAAILMYEQYTRSE